MLHIVDQKRLEITHHHPARTLGIGQFGSISLGLLKGSKQRTVALPDRFKQILIQALLLDEHVRGFNVPVDEAGTGQLHLILERDKLSCVLDAEHVGEQIHPERLRFTFLIASAFPFAGKLFGGCFLLFFSFQLFFSHIIHRLKQELSSRLKGQEWTRQCRKVSVFFRNMGKAARYPANR